MKPELMGLQEIAALLGVERGIVDVWRQRGKLPKPDYIVSGNPVWLASSIQKWAKTRTG